jgi:hypothetical protein
MHDITGEFETHLTLQLDTAVKWASLRQSAERRGLKCVHILLERGDFPSQPMLTRHAAGTLREQMAAADQLREELQAEGFLIQRVKIEAAPANAGVPQTSADTAHEPGDRYFEQHVKLLLPAKVDIASLIEVVERHGAHLSRNALRMRSDGQYERFVTQRCRSMGRREARQQLDILVQALAPMNYSILEVEEEYVVYDSDLGLDAGWLPDANSK